MKRAKTPEIVRRSTWLLRSQDIANYTHVHVIDSYLIDRTEKSWRVNFPGGGVLNRNFGGGVPLVLQKPDPVLN